MRPIEFPQQSVVFAKDQPQYLPLPAHISADGEVTSCWYMGLRERLRVALTGRVYVTQLSFFQPLQPQRISLDAPSTHPLDNHCPYTVASH